MRLDTKAGKARQSMHTRAADVADGIYKDMLDRMAEIGGDVNSLEDWATVAGRLGCPVTMFYKECSRTLGRMPGFYAAQKTKDGIEEAIGLNMAMPQSYRMWVIWHELAHCLRHRVETCGWGSKGPFYHGKELHYSEAVARAVERCFMESGDVRADVHACYESRY